MHTAQARSDVPHCGFHCGLRIWLLPFWFAACTSAVVLIGDTAVWTERDERRLGAFAVRAVAAGG
eukprot:5790859-Prymnesium_polylepis.1